MKDPFDIYIIGTGILPTSHLTLEAVDVLSRAKIVFYVDKSFGIEQVLGKYCDQIVDLHAACYVENESRLDAYRRMASMVVSMALEGSPVVFALYGHPLVYSFPPLLVVAAAKMLDLTVKILPGISSLDTLFVDLVVDPCTNGIQMYEATDLLLRERPIQPDVPCVIWQVGAVESRLFSTRVSDSSRFGNFRSYLERFYPGDTEVAAVYSSTIPLLPSQVTRFQICEMEDYADVLHQGATLYIAPASFRAIRNHELMKRMDDPEHLDRLGVTPYYGKRRGQ